MIVTRPITTNYGNYDRKVSVQHGSGTLKLGQIIDAVTLSNSNKGQVSIRIGEAVFNASTNIPFQQNAHLTLEVVQLQPHILLKLISSPAGAGTSALKDAMISWLPQQRGIAPVLAELIHRTMAGDDSLQRQSTRTLVTALIHGLPGRNTLVHAEGVRQAILQSGLFLESILSRPGQRYRNSIKTDIKACMLGICHSIEPDVFGDSTEHHILNNRMSNSQNTVIPPRRKGLPVTQASAPCSNTPDACDISEYGAELYNKIQGAIARLGLLQLYTAENIFNGEYYWQLEIPVKHSESIETLSISIENEQKDPINEDRNFWVVNLALNLPQLGPIDIRISMYKQGVSSCFWSESRNILSLIESQFAQLRANLKQNGIETLALCCQQGQAVSTKPVETEVSSIDLQV